MIRAGFTLIELAVVLIIVGLLVGIGFEFGSDYMASQRLKGTRTQLRASSEALALFVAQNRRLPCPDDGAAADGREDRQANGLCTAQNRGILPWVTLGISEDAGKDRWGRRLSYRVDDDPVVGLTRDNGLNLTACDPRNSDPPGPGSPNCGNGVSVGEATYGKGFHVLDGAGGVVVMDPDPPTGTPVVAPSGAAYVIISHGENGLGAYMVGGALMPPPTAANELPNRNNLAPPAAGFVDARYNDNQTSGQFFDDLIERATVLAVAQKAGLGPRQP